MKQWNNLTIKQKGFSLIEVLLGIVIIGFVVGLIMNIPGALRVVGTSQNESVAKEIAVKEIEDKRSGTYSALTLGTIPITDSRLSSLPNGSGQVVIDNCPATVCDPTYPVKMVTVTITWEETSSTKEVELTTLISDGGIK